MKIIEIKDRNPLLIEQLLDVWESSVKATLGSQNNTWKCCSSLLRKGEKDWAGNCFYTGKKDMPLPCAPLCGACNFAGNLLY